MSGGVDSSVAACLMAEQGFDCIGCTMKLCGSSPAASGDRACCTLRDAEDAGSVARRLGMPYYVFNFADDFRRTVIRNFVRAYACGRTPNPCIDCNRYMKFGRLYDRARILGCDCIVTGHYARITEENGTYLLKKALDASKDQSYVLYRMNQAQLAHTRFPLGELHKSQVRQMAERRHLLNAGKPDSQDICFVPGGDYAGFVEQYTGIACPAGHFIDTDGTVLGTHKGIIHYTIGQRRGLGLSFPEPMYVGDIDPRKNTVTLCRDRGLYHSAVLVQDCTWVAGTAPAETFRCRAKIRYRHPEQPCTAELLGNSRVLLRFDAPQRAPAPGQSAVLYDGDTVLGGGVIAGSQD